MKASSAIVLLTLSSFAICKPANAADEAAALASMEKIVAAYNSFFSTPRKMISRYLCQNSCQGEYVIMQNYIISNIDYDIEKTTSLTAPYSAIISFNSYVSNSSFCGDMKWSFFSKYHFFSSESVALKTPLTESCFEPPYVGALKTRVEYLYRKDKWVLQTATELRINGPVPSQSILAGLGVPSNSSVPVVDEQSREFNRGWIETMTP